MHVIVQLTLRLPAFVDNPASTMIFTWCSKSFIAKEFQDLKRLLMRNTKMLASVNVWTFLKVGINLMIAV